MTNYEEGCFTNSMTDYFEKLKVVIDHLDKKAIDEAMGAILKAYDESATIYTFGNGGSAATASHMANDFNKGISCDIQHKFRLQCLNDNVATIMAIANDISYDDVFIKQLENKLNPNSIIIAISGSGNSKNIIKAVEYAKSCDCKVIGMSGYSGGMLKQLSDFSMHVNIDDMQIVEDVHMIFNHMMMKVFCKHLDAPKYH